MSGVSIEHNRRAVYNALSRVTDDRLLTQQSYHLWEKSYSSSKVFHVTQFVDDVVKNIGVRDQLRRKLAVALYAALGQPESSLAEVPDAVRSEVEDAPGERTIRTSAVDNVEETGDPQTVVFRALLRELVNSVGQQSGEDLQELAACVLDGLNEIEDSTARKTVKSWAEARFDPKFLPEGVPGGAMQSVLHQLYVGACDAVGPVKADRFLSGAVRTVSALPLASEYPPSRLL